MSADLAAPSHHNPKLRWANARHLAWPAGCPRRRTRVGERPGNRIIAEMAPRGCGCKWARCASRHAPMPGAESAPTLYPLDPVTATEPPLRVLASTLPLHVQNSGGCRGLTTSVDSSFAYCIGPHGARARTLLPAPAAAGHIADQRREPRVARGARDGDPPARAARDGGAPLCRLRAEAIHRGARRFSQRGVRRTTPPCGPARAKMAA